MTNYHRMSRVKQPAATCGLSCEAQENVIPANRYGIPGDSLAGMHSVF
ncbi:MAG: hypothetical protein MI866_18240 [Bacteroidales bacterium]|nr:hypothetical protein [Bacteroidales bacterium]